MFRRPEPPPHTSMDEVRARANVRGQSGVLIGTCEDMCPQCEVQYIDGEVNRDWASQPGRIGYDIRCVLMCNALCPASFVDDSCPTFLGRVVLRYLPSVRPHVSTFAV